MASASGMPPILVLKRSAQSATFTMTAAWQVVYTDSSTQAYLFAGATIDLTNMAAADIVQVRIEKVVAPGGNWIMHDQVSYADAQPVNHVAVSIGGIPDVYGVRISMRQTAGVLRNINCEFNSAKRLGME